MQTANSEFELRLPNPFLLYHEHLHYIICISKASRLLIPAYWLVGRVFANGPGDQKWYLMLPCLTRSII